VYEYFHEFRKHEKGVIEENTFCLLKEERVDHGQG
jgi:hypothetical protein